MKMKWISTTYVEEKKQQTESESAFQPDKGTEMLAVNVYPGVEYQTFDGFGAAITEAAGHTFSLMSAEKQKQILDAYYGKDGNRYNLVRTHIDSSDFSLGQYAAMNDPEDREFRSFDLSRDEQYILPLLNRAEETAGRKMQVMLTPWSPPSFMKSNGQRVGGGSLLPEYRAFWADYICHYIKEYQSRGVNVEMITIQNEPIAVQKWDSCIYTAEEEKVFLRNFLYPAMEKNGLTDIAVNIWDHNKERVFERACDIIDEETDRMVQGVAFHWYSGDHFEGVQLVRDKFPQKKLIFTEGCVEYSRFSDAGQLENAQMYAHDIIGNMNAGMTAFIDWNLLLNKQGGPNHVGNFCDAPVMCDTDNDIVQEKLSLTYIGHFSRHIVPGAKRIGLSKYTDKLEATAFKNPDGSLVLVFMNRTNKELPIKIRLNGQVADFTLPTGAIATGILPAE
ncbi:glycoside hydrolase family 30 protein [Gorillibacterium massiliense]|uniref:glycoside hydrolase family 30 protein n=1 Tax=Gorillibacterium massiliense TaxID=1280390 RepID=UPI0004B663E8|nr:glycoside hydrolase family 30 beta sandwich domain-containing protein [Gorillibacterium massiliense]